ncbi:MAG: type I restriction endonuclease [Methanosarcinaceae archaeon]
MGKNPLKNHFAIAEEVTVKGENNKRHDVVLYVNGIAFGVLELNAAPYQFPKESARTLTTKNKYLYVHFLPPFNL